jgi:hypothetical protein
MIPFPVFPHRGTGAPELGGSQIIASDKIKEKDKRPPKGL